MAAKGNPIFPVRDYWVPADNVAIMSCLPLDEAQRRALREKDIALPPPNVDGR